MNFGQIYRAATAQVVSLTQVERLPNANEEFTKAMVNAAYHKVERAALWKFSEAEAEISSAVDTREATGVPVDFNVSVALWDNEAKCLLDFHDERQKFLDVTDTGSPQYYAVWGGDVRFYPLPKKVQSYTLRYYKKWVDLSDDSDVPEIPETWHDLLINYAAGKLAQRLPPTGDRFLPHSLAQPFLDDFSLDLQRMLDSPLVLPSWDAIPNYGYQDEVLSLQEW